mmetsp:Transcript_70908/g.125297  ORF Transcript_70908/g.125297 Transcript_70908/m.125297 type:complete len:163 (-) Transcript_70908:75-563(-)
MHCKKKSARLLAQLGRLQGLLLAFHQGLIPGCQAKVGQMKPKRLSLGPGLKAAHNSQGTLAGARELSQHARRSSMKLAPKRCRALASQTSDSIILLPRSGCAKVTSERGFKTSLVQGFVRFQALHRFIPLCKAARFASTQTLSVFQAKRGHGLLSVSDVTCT